MRRGNRRHRTLERLGAVAGTFLVMASVMLSTGAAVASAADTGARAPGASVAPNGAWTDPDGVFADGGTVATAPSNNADQGYASFGFSVPGGSIIDGITVAAEAMSSGSACRLSAALSGSGGSGLTSFRNATLPTSFGVVTFGGSADTWGRVWDPTQLTDGNFNLVLRSSDPGSNCAGTDTTSVDWVTVTVTYRTIKNGGANAAISKGVCNKADFNFIIDMSGSIGVQDGKPSNLPQLQAGITDFVNQFSAAGGDGLYSGTRFSGTSATTMTTGYDTPTSFKSKVAALSSPSGTTPTATGIDTGAANDSGDRADAPNIMFVVTDGSPNVPGGSLSAPPTWLQAANAAIDSADAARGDGYIVEAVYLSTAGDPGDTTLPFSPAGDAQWAAAVMKEIGGGHYFPADFKNFADDLFKALKCAPPPTVDLTKSVDDDSKPEPGGTFTFTLSIKNTSDHEVTITALTDTNALSAECKALVGKKLAAGATVECSYQVDHDKIGTYPNTASVTVKDSDGGTASDTDDESVEVTDILPDVTLVKGVTPASRPEPGGVFTYTLTITNPSDETVTITALTDDNALSQACKDLVGTTLVPGASTSCTYTVTRTDAGTYPNQAKVSVSDDEGNKASDTDDESVTVTDVKPTITVDKSATPASRPEPGGSFTYTVKVTNTSIESVTISSLVDDKFGNLNGKGSCATGTSLAPGASYTCTFSGNVTGNAGLEHTNTVTAKATDNEGNEAKDDDDATVTLTDVAPTITVDKTASPLTRPEPGGTFTYTVVVTNTSDESVTITSLIDDKFGDLAGQGTCAPGAELDPDGTYSCSFTGEFTGNAGDKHTNTVTAGAVDDDGTSATASDDATVSLTDVKPTVEVDKTADPTVLDEPGGQVTFTVKVTNTSFEAVTLDSLSDDIHGDLNGQGTCVADGSVTIAAGDTYTCSFSAMVSGNAGDFETDIVTAIVSDDEGSTASDEDDATVTIINVDPSVRVIKDATPLSSDEPGGTFRFDVTVINDSAEDVTLISLTDDIYGNLDGRGTCAIGATLPANGGSYSCWFGGSFIGDAGDSQTDIVTATVSDDDGSERSNQDDATVTLTDVPPTVAVDKTASPDKVEAGTTVTFTVKVTNTSIETVWLNDLVDSIHGDLDGKGTCVADGSISIAPDATYTCSFTAVVNETETDVVTATVSDNEENEASDDDDATVTVTDLVIDKSVENSTKDRGTDDGAVKANPGDTLHYTLDWTMTNGPLHGVVISDVLPEGLGTPSNISDGGVYDAARRTITWDLGTVEGDGSVSYDVVVAAGASAMEQPLRNVATIDSDETNPDSDDADTSVIPGGEVGGETSRPTLPPTDAIRGDGSDGSSGTGLALTILFLVGLVAAASVLTPARVKARRRDRR